MVVGSVYHARKKQGAVDIKMIRKLLFQGERATYSCFEKQVWLAVNTAHQEATHTFCFNL